MKFSAIFYVAVTTILLMAVAVMVYYDVSYDIVLYTVVAGQAWWLLTVYKVLTDDYFTKKDFGDWYEDNPIGRE